MQNNLAKTNIEKLNIQLSKLEIENNLANIQLSKLDTQINVANSTLQILHKHNKIIYQNLAKELYKQFENSADYNSKFIHIFTYLINIKDLNEKLTFKFLHFEFTNEPAINIVNKLLYNLGPNSCT